MRPGVHIDIVMQIILTREANLCPEYNRLTIVCIGTLLTTDHVTVKWTATQRIDHTCGNPSHLISCIISVRAAADIHGTTIYVLSSAEVGLVKWES